MTIPFTPFLERLRRQTDIASQVDLARALDVNRSAITQAKVRDAVPPKWILALSRRYGLSPDWLEYGSGEPRPRRLARADDTRRPDQGLFSLERGQKNPEVLSPVQRVVRAHGMGPTAPTPEEELFYVPKAAARLCAGGGSFEVDTLPVAKYPMPLRWLSQMGRPANMIFMDVVGNSMEPGICDGDMVLVDQGHTRITRNWVLAVGVEEAIYLKRVEERPGGVILRSDNSAFSPMELYGDELSTFSIIGKVVWLCRDYRNG